MYNEVIVVSTHSLDPCLWGSPIIPLLVHKPSYLSIWSATPSLQRCLSTNPGVTSVVRLWVQLKRWCVSCVWVLQRGHSGDGCDLASTLCKYDLRKADLFVLSWAMVRRVRRGSLSSELLMCGGGVRSILLLPLVARCLPRDNRYMYIAHVCFMSVVAMPPRYIVFRGL